MEFSNAEARQASFRVCFVIDEDNNVSAMCLQWTSIILGARLGMTARSKDN